MAIHTQLPIYKVAYDLLGVATDYIRNMPRDVKVVIGGKIRDLCLDLSTLVFDANCAMDKSPHLEELIRSNEKLQLLFRFCQDKRYISKSQYAKAVEMTTSIGKQAHGWKRKCHAPVT